MFKGSMLIVGLGTHLNEIYLNTNHMGAKKSSFMIVEDATGLISNYPSLNKGFVKDEVLNSTNLDNMGLYTNNGSLEMAYQSRERCFKNTPES